MDSLLIKNARIVNEGSVTAGDVLIRGPRIERIGGVIDVRADRELDATGLHLLPGVIDDQVHFREPGLTDKADLGTESRACAAGGVTSFMEMPNTVPPTLTQALLEAKYARAAQTSLVNYSFYMGAANDNLEEVLRTDPAAVCGVKVFMGSSTGNMLVDNAATLEALFARTPMLIATHCEDEATIRRNLEAAHLRYGDDVPPAEHPLIRSRAACLLSSTLAVELARRHGARLHVLHISTADELALFANDVPLAQKRITAEACTHHLWFTDADYAERGMFIKWNPAVKTAADRAALRQALADDRLDVVATDHAPHTLAEKQQAYFKAPSGAPMVQHALPLMLELFPADMPFVVRKMCHAPADCFRLRERGYIREGYFADLTLVDLDRPLTVTRESLYYKCGWSPLEGTTFGASVRCTMVNGQVVFEDGRFGPVGAGMRLAFEGWG